MVGRSGRVAGRWGRMAGCWVRVVSRWVRVVSRWVRVVSRWVRVAGPFRYRMRVPKWMSYDDPGCVTLSRCSPSLVTARR